MPRRGTHSALTSASHGPPPERPAFSGCSIQRDSASPSCAAIAAREILRWRKTLNEAISRHTGRPADQVERDSDRDYYMSATKAKDYGIVDHVVVSTRDAQAVVGQK